jgi:hypothetical protein
LTFLKKYDIIKEKIFFFPIGSPLRENIIKLKRLLDRAKISHMLVPIGTRRFAFVRAAMNLGGMLILGII